MSSRCPSASSVERDRCVVGQAGRNIGALQRVRLDPLVESSQRIRHSRPVERRGLRGELATAASTCPACAFGGSGASEVARTSAPQLVLVDELEQLARAGLEARTRSAP